MEKIKWGVMGTASIAAGCTIPGMMESENCELYAIAGRNPKKTEEFKEKFGFKKAYVGYEELLADPEIKAVYIPLPNNLHYEWCMKAMKAGKHVLCEKPLVPTKKQAQELFDTAKECGVYLMEAFAYQHSPYVTALKEDLKSIGTVEYIESAFLVQAWAPEDIRMHKETFGGSFYDLGCYCLSMMIGLLDAVPQKAQAISEYNENGVDMFTTAYLTFPGNIRASINSGMFFDRSGGGSRTDRFYIHGTNGYIKSPVEYNQAGDLSYEICINGVKQMKTVHAKQNYRLEAENLSDCIINGGTPHVSAEFSIMEAEALELVIRAMGY